MWSCIITIIMKLYIYYEKTKNWAQNPTETHNEKIKQNEKSTCIRAIKEMTKKPIQHTT